VAECVTPGVTLAGRADSELGNCLHIRKSMVDRIFPTQLDVPLLAHAREVDIHDTELMMGDDDGFLAVVITNRLPLPGRDAGGVPVPVKYLACLVNLESQFTRLLARAPAPEPFTTFPLGTIVYHADEARWDHTRMSSAGGGTDTSAPAGPAIGVPSGAAAPYERASTWTAETGTRGAADVYTEMARDFGTAAVSGFVAGDVVMLDPTLVFPVLLHWSFTSFGSTTFRSLVEGLDSGLLGTVGEEAATREGRAPLEVVETGHTGLPHRTRRGDPVRSWYRGPFVAHPTVDGPEGRLPLAHAADQLRIVVPDGREDISLAAAFEIGRLLALAHPSMVAALLRWRQTGFQAIRRDTVWAGHGGFLDEVLGGEYTVDGRIGVLLGRGLAAAVAGRPELFLGDPRVLVDAGRPLAVDLPVDRALADGFGFDPKILAGDPVTVLGRLRESTVLRPGDAGGTVPVADVRVALTETLNREVDRMAADALSMPPLGSRPGTIPRGQTRGPLDRGEGRPR